MDVDNAETAGIADAETGPDSERTGVSGSNTEDLISTPGAARKFEFAAKEDSLSDEADVAAKTGSEACDSTVSAVGGENDVLASFSAEHMIEPKDTRVRGVMIYENRDMMKNLH